ncbi:MAG: hypothetical protein JSW73_05620 [Candidatus Woesearchaeota archaeon]|nr:MAG: hypothetical protein JSW73_05620 [Candidatus Woesearchaeota archaeon]
MIIAIKEINKGVYRIENIAEIDNPTKKLTKFIKSPSNFVLSFRASDNSYHEVNSIISESIKKNIELIEKGIALPSIAASITGSRELKTKRYVIWKNGKEAYLVGETLQALRKVSEITS